MPSTTFTPTEKEFDSCALGDEDFDLTGRDIAKYSYQNVETPVSSWTDMFEHVVKYLHAEDKSILSALVYSTGSETELGSYFSSNPDGLRTPLKIDDDVYVEKNTSTTLKISILRRLFVLFRADPMDLVFSLRDSDQDKAAGKNRYDLRKKTGHMPFPSFRRRIVGTEPSGIAFPAHQTRLTGILVSGDSASAVSPTRMKRGSTSSLERAMQKRTKACLTI